LVLAVAVLHFLKISNSTIFDMIAMVPEIFAITTSRLMKENILNTQNSVSRDRWRKKVSLNVNKLFRRFLIKRRVA
jgi:hypothetical protein